MTIAAAADSDYFINKIQNICAKQMYDAFAPSQNKQIIIDHNRCQIMRTFYLNDDI